jgi:hypothetical protein
MRTIVLLLQAKVIFGLILAKNFQNMQSAFYQKDSNGTRLNALEFVLIL